MRRFNEWLAVRTVALVGTMECAWAFLMLVLIPLAEPEWQTVIFYLSSTIIQLVLLPLIMVGQGVSERRQRAQADQDHAALLETLTTIREDHAALRELVDAVHAKVHEQNGG